MKKMLLLGASLCALSATPVLAQETDTSGASGLEAIVVTARKTSENLQTVPISISAVSAETLERRGVDNVAQVADFAPNVTLDGSAPISGSSSALVAYIRGIGQSDFAFNFEPGVGLYVDGVYVARNMGGVMDLLDLERVEVLKGPQGTLFGRNTIGGAISLVTRKPSHDFGGKFEATLGSFNRHDIRGSINIPLGETLAASLAFSSKDRDGFVHRIPYPAIKAADQADFRGIDLGVMSAVPNGNDLGNQNTQSARAQLLWTPNDRLEVRIAADITRTRENSAPAVLVDTFGGGIADLYNACVSGAPIPVCGSVVNGRAGGSINPQFTSRTIYDDRFVTGSHRTTYANGLAGTAMDAWGIFGQISYELTDDIDLKSITAYRDLDSVFGEDADGSPLVIDHHAFEMLQHQFSQELQITGKTGRLKWLGGLYYFTESGGITDFVPLAGGLFQVYGPNKLTNRSYAAFGEATFDLTDSLSFTLGGRYTAERKRFVGGQRDLNALNFQLGTPLAAFPVPSDPTILYPPGVNRQKFNDFSMRGGVQYKFNSDVFAYLSYSEGFKAGGWDTRLTGPELTALDFSPETARTYEIGIKSELANRSIRFNIAAFRTEYRNLQLIVQRGISPLTTNAGQSVIKGIEVDATWAITPDFQIAATYGFIDAKYTKLDARANTAGIFLDNKFNNTPRNTFSLAADYRIPMGADSNVALHADYSWRDDTYNDAVNTPQLMQKAMGLANATVKYNDAAGWSISAGVTNLTNKDYISSGFNQPGVGFTYATIGRPREWSVKAGYQF